LGREREEQEEKDAVVRERIFAREERMKADEYAAIQKAQRDEEAELEKAFDKDFVSKVLARERALTEKEADDKRKAKQKSPIVPQKRLCMHARP